MLARLILAGLLLALPAAAQEGGDVIEGRASVTDGDTIRIGEHRIRLFGVDAPEMDTAAGPAAKDFMRDLVQDQRTRCQVVDIDRYRRFVAVCHAVVDSHPVDLGAEVIRSGHALAYRRFLKGSLLEGSYVALEREARRGCRGRWRDLLECRGR